MNHFSRLPLSLSDNRLGTQISEILEAEGIQPRIYSMNYDTNLSLAFCCRSLSACFTTHMRLSGQWDALPDNINIFPVLHQGKVLTQSLSLIRRKDRYITNFSRRFLDLLFTYFADIQQMKLEHKG